MTTSTLVIDATTEQVRLARLVVVSAARAAGMDENVLDDVKLAVGEAVSRAVVRSRGVPDAVIEVQIVQAQASFSVEVSDQAASTAVMDDGLATAVIAGLAPEFAVESTDAEGQKLRISWPL